MPTVSTEQLHEMRAVAQRAAAKVASIKEKATEAVGHVVQTVEVGVVAFGFGMARGRYGDILLPGGISADLAVGVGAHLLAFMGAAGKYDEHLHNMADGALACYVACLGGGVGSEMAKKAGQSPASSVFRGDTVAGSLDVASGAGPLSSAELQSILAG